MDTISLSIPQGCMCLISLTLVTFLSIFAMLVLPRGGFYHNSTGLAACDPFYPRPSFRILAACLFYFPTTMMLMYCYGSAFHVNRLRLRRSVVSSIVSAPDEFTGSAIERVSEHVYLSEIKYHFSPLLPTLTSSVQHY